jgi:CheY-like chemotaxis protein
MNKTILIIDDEEDVRAITQLGLEMSGDWTVLTASSGTKGIKIALQSPPDVILLDLMMPDLDGCTTLQQLKTYPQLQPIPVILMTAKEQEFLPESAQKLDFAGVITKPFRPLQLTKIIAKIIVNYSNSHNGEAQSLWF